MRSDRTREGVASGARGDVAALRRPLATPRELIARHGGAVAGYGLPFLLVLYLGLEGGGYDAVVRGELGLALWWLVLLGCLVGALPLTRVTRAAWAGVGLLGAFALWTALAIGWSESSERSVAELARVATLLGALVLATFVQGRDALRRTVAGAGAAVAIVGVIALLSRLQPGWLDGAQTAQFLAAGERRLNYPLNYWNGLAALIAIGLPLLLVISLRARHVATRALALAAIPALSLAAFYTFSRGGAGEIALAAIAFFALYPARLAALPNAAVATLASTLLIVAATQRDALENGLATAAASSQGDQMLAMTLVVCAGAGLLGAALALADRHGIGPRLAVGRRRSQVAAGIGTAIAIIVAIGVGAPGELSDRWQEFKSLSGPPSGDASRFESAAGSGRYQLWEAAVDANASQPVTGIGPGTFEFWEARSGAHAGFVRDAHSLYLEALAELGIVGFALILGLVGLVLAIGVARALRPGRDDAADGERRAWLAAATAACLAFVAAAAVDWAWELTVLPVTFLLLAAAILGPSAEPRRRRASRFQRRFPALARPLVAFVAVTAMIAIVPPLAGLVSVRESQARVNAAELAPALVEARDAVEIQPYAATPSLQEALVLELEGDLAGAAAAATEATEDEPTNWRTWLVLSRIEAERGRVEAAIAAYREARSLNPRSQLFAR